MQDTDMARFERWVKSHGGMSLEKVSETFGSTDGGWQFATYASHTTEAAWRAWANKEYLGNVPVGITAETVKDEKARLIEAKKRVDALKKSVESILEKWQTSFEELELQVMLNKTPPVENSEWEHVGYIFNLTDGDGDMTTQMLNRDPLWVYPSHKISGVRKIFAPRIKKS